MNLLVGTGRVVFVHECVFSEEQTLDKSSHDVLDQQFIASYGKASVENRLSNYEFDPKFRNTHESEAQGHHRCSQCLTVSYFRQAGCTPGSLWRITLA